MSKKTVLFDWEVADTFGWGVYGLNLMLRGQGPGRRVVPTVWPPQKYSISSPLTLEHLLRLRNSWEPTIRAQSSDVFLTGLGNSNTAIKLPKMRNVGVIFFEANPLPSQEVQKLAEFEFVVAGSTWNFECLSKFGVRARLVVQGVDLERFRPAVKRLFKDRFVVFSGGKLEHRKGQDIVVKAFSAFAQRHPEALLICSWASPWGGRFVGPMNETGLLKTPFIDRSDFCVATRAWLEGNGISPSQSIVLPSVPNFAMPEVFREVDIAIFPNRCEGGTNLVAMEALASGLVCAISCNTGHLDLIGDRNCIPLRTQLPVRGGANGFLDWGESSVEEVLETLESAFFRRHGVTPERARASVSQLSWEKTIDSLLGELGIDEN